MKKEKLTSAKFPGQVLTCEEMRKLIGGNGDTGYGTGYGTGTGYGIDINDPSKPMFGGTITNNTPVGALDANPYA